MGPSGFRLRYLDDYFESFTAWIENDAEVIDTTHRTPTQVALRLAKGLES
jgi:hypothetical protein